MSGQSEIYALMILVVAGFLPNEIWRMMGLFVGSGISEDSEILVWVRAVATAILAGVIAQVVLAPPGALAVVPSAIRIGAIAAGFLTYIVSGRRIIVGVITAEIIIIASRYWFG